VRQENGRQPSYARKPPYHQYHHTSPNYHSGTNNYGQYSNYYPRSPDHTNKHAAHYSSRSPYNHYRRTSFGDSQDQSSPYRHYDNYSAENPPNGTLDPLLDCDDPNIIHYISPQTPMFQESCDMICTLGAMDDIRSYLDLKFSESSKDMQDLRNLITNLAQDHPHFNTPQTPQPPKPISVPTLGPANATVEELLDLATPLMEPNLISSPHRSTPPPINKQFSSSSNSSSISANHPTNGDTDSEPDHSAPPIKPTNTQGNPVFKASQEIAPTQLDSPPSSAQYDPRNK